MPSISIEIYRLRFTVCETVKKMIEQGLALNESHALKVILSKNLPTGFTGDEKKVYNQYRQFKRTHLKD